MSVNEHEIAFAEQTAERAIETGEAMDEYLKKLINVVLGYIDAAKIPGKDGINSIECRASIGKWGFVIRTSMWNDYYPKLRLYYSHKLLAKINFKEIRAKKIVSKSEDE